MRVTSEPGARIRHQAGRRADGQARAASARVQRGRQPHHRPQGVFANGAPQARDSPILHFRRLCHCCASVCERPSCLWSHQPTPPRVSISKPHTFTHTPGRNTGRSAPERSHPDHTLTSPAPIHPHRGGRHTSQRPEPPPSPTPHRPPGGGSVQGHLPSFVRATTPPKTETSDELLTTPATLLSLVRHYGDVALHFLPAPQCLDFLTESLLRVTLSEAKVAPRPAISLVRCRHDETFTM